MDTLFTFLEFSGLGGPCLAGLALLVAGAIAYQIRRWALK